MSSPRACFFKRVQERPSIVKVDGVWVHQGSAEPGQNWGRLCGLARLNLAFDAATGFLLRQAQVIEGLQV